MAHVEAVGYGLVSENTNVGSCGNPSGGISSAPMKKPSIMGRVTASAK